MVKKALILTLLIVLVIMNGQAAGFNADLKRIDDLYYAEKYEESFRAADALVALTPSLGDKAALLWRLSRARLQITSESERRGASKDDVIAGYEEGERLADEAIETDSSQAESYYWKASNMGKAGSARGILNSLMLAGPMHDTLKDALKRDPDMADAYFVLGQLYYKVPGKPLSFGNPDYGVNLARKSLILMKQNIKTGTMRKWVYSYELELASALAERNWKASKRVKEQGRKKKKIKKAGSTLERDFYYESTLTLKKISDRDEAAVILKELTRKIRDLSNPSRGDLNTLEDAEKVLAEL